MATIGNIHETEVLDRQHQAHSGALAFADRFNYTWTLVNSDPQAKQTHVFTIATATAAATYTVNINGTDISFVAVGATKALIVAEMTTAINASSAVRGQVEASDDGVDACTVTSLWPGRSFTASESDAKVTNAAGTSNATATVARVPRLCVSRGWNAETDTELGHVARASSLTAMVLEWTYTTYEVGIDITAVIEIADERYVFTVTSATDANTTITALVAAINGGMPANTVLAAAPGSGVMTLAAEVAGQAFDASVHNAEAFSTGALDVTTAATVLRGPETDAFFRPAVSLRAHDEEVNSLGEVEYPANAGIRCLKKGHLWVPVSATVATTDPVYVYVGATEANQGQFYNASGTDRIKVPRSLARWCYNDRSGELALLEVNFN